ncbi:hypothetical protein JCM12296A_57010 [Desulfosarcina cetonica]
MGVLGILGIDKTANIELKITPTTIEAEIGTGGSVQTCLVVATKIISAISIWAVLILKKQSFIPHHQGAKASRRRHKRE